jgi:hypothetical protein
MFQQFQFDVMHMQRVECILVDLLLVTRMHAGERLHACFKRWTVNSCTPEKFVKLAWEFFLQVEHLLKLSEVFPGSLELFEADLLRDGSFDEAVTYSIQSYLVFLAEIWSYRRDRQTLRRFRPKLQLFCRSRRAVVRNLPCYRSHRGAKFVFHTASPYYFEGVSDPEKELIEPARQGTRNLFSSVKKAKGTVERVVVTSSVVGALDSTQPSFFGVGQYFFD